MGRAPLCIIRIKMATLSTLCTLLLLLFLMHGIKAVTVEVTVPVYPVTVGGVLAIQCEIRNMENDHEIRMYRVTKAHTEQLTSGPLYRVSSLEQRIFVAKRDMPGKLTVFFATIVDVVLLDQGEYFCKVYTLSGSDHVKVSEGSVHVNIYFLPNSIYPQCRSVPAVVENMNENVPLELTCISAKGNPAVELRWIDNSNQEISSRSMTHDDTVSAEITLAISPSHGKIYICEMTNPGFPDFQRICQIGPVTIKANTKVEDTRVVKHNMPLSPSETNNHKTRLSNGCSSECPSNDEYTILYLSVATLGSAMLCVVFLITTIIMCIKYKNAPSEVRSTQRNMAIADGSEKVYVSLDRRPEPAISERRSIYKEPDRSSLYSAPERRSLYKEPEIYNGSDTSSTTYMSVEDPNNPGSKVLMPKEVFEEFYNSLTMKKV